MSLQRFSKIRGLFIFIFFAPLSQAAIAGGYPEPSLYKLHVRQAMCFTCLGQEKVAEVCWDRARAAISKMEDESDRTTAEMFINQKYADRFTKIKVKDCSVTKNLSFKLPNPHPKYPAFSNKVRLEVDETPLTL